METDSPDIPPHWLYRTGTARRRATMRNEPAELPRIAATLAELRGASAPRRRWRCTDRGDRATRPRCPRPKATRGSSA